MKSRTRQHAHKLRAHPTAASETHAAQAAVVPPSNDAASQSKAAAVEDMSTAKPGVFDKAAFMAAVRAAIEKAAPKDNKEADDFKSSGKADAVKAQVKGQVTAGKDSSAADIKGKSDAPPDPGKAVVKPVTAMEPAKRPDVPADPGAAAAMPARAPPDQTNLTGAPNEVNSKMADAKVTEEQLANSNEPEFTGALAAKKTGEAHSATAPTDVRAQEAQVLGGAKTGAAGSAQGALGAMVATKGGANAAVGGQKGATKASDEAAHQQVAAQIEGIYQHTKGDAETILKDLDGKVDTAFEKGEKEAKDAFEEYHSSRVTDWKLHRYLLAPGGLIQWGIDQFKPLNPELIKIFSQARAAYMTKMDAVISGVADLIGSELTRARTRIAQGRAEIKDFVARQKGDLAKFAREAEGSIGAKFDDLDKSVDDKQSGLVDDLAGKYVEARKGIDERITALQDENKGLWDQAKAAVAGAVDTILKLKDMLLGVLARAKGAIEKIVADPMKFLGNLVSGVKSGLNQFVSNIAGHLKKGLMGWLFGELANAGIELPEKFDLKGIFNLVASILGLTWTNFRTRLVAKVGEKVAGKIEQGLDFVKAMASAGISGAWQWIVTKIGNLKDMVMDQIKSFVIEKVVMAGIQWVIGLLNPAAAFVKACKMIYDVVMWFVDNGQRIKEFVDSVLDSVESILAGNLGKVASMIEESLASILPLAIGFLASLLGLGGLAEKIKKILMTVQKPVNKVFDFLITKAVKFGKGVLSKLKNSKLGKAAAKMKAKAKAAYAKGKAYVKGKVEAGKKWVKGKVNAAKKWIAAKKDKLLGRDNSPAGQEKRINTALGAAVAAANKYGKKPVTKAMLSGKLLYLKFRHGLSTLALEPGGTTWNVTGTIQRTTRATNALVAKEESEVDIKKKEQLAESLYNKVLAINLKAGEACLAAGGGITRPVGGFKGRTALERKGAEAAGIRGDPSASPTLSEATYRNVLEMDGQRWEAGGRIAKALFQYADKKGCSLDDARPRSVEQSMDIAKETGVHVPVSKGANDQETRTGKGGSRERSYGFSGLSSEFHAERRVYSETKATAIGVTLDPCHESCSLFFRLEAKKIGETIVIWGPSGSHRYLAK